MQLLSMQREDHLQQQQQAMKDNYDKICSENRQLMHCLPGSRKTRKRDKQETKPEVGESATSV